MNEDINGIISNKARKRRRDQYTVNENIFNINYSLTYFLLTSMVCSNAEGEERLRSCGHMMGNEGEATKLRSFSHFSDVMASTHDAHLHSTTNRCTQCAVPKH